MEHIAPDMRTDKHFKVSEYIFIKYLKRIGQNLRVGHL